LRPVHLSIKKRDLCLHQKRRKIEYANLAAVIMKK
jgi:hypothetical protein